MFIYFSVLMIYRNGFSRSAPETDASETRANSESVSNTTAVQVRLLQPLRSPNHISWLCVPVA